MSAYRHQRLQAFATIDPPSVLVQMSAMPMPDQPLHATSPTPLRPVPGKSIQTHSKPRRITITLEDQLYHSLLEFSRRERRSISNLAAHLLARSLQEAPSHDTPFHDD
ncbi:MAG: hypothetical protein VKJ44_10300 [Synechococcus sp.]|nr:hypothetical protein [Synechococcus sp.]